ncbi:YedE family putative selenium transporter [Desulfothermobacter acidiphilus]|uniref:YedE family putative selenium transporter n=1 Tax=Desulfothermobacter acidiphilus TaxID=1938353 RepID=UPI003F88CADC
MPDKVRIGAAGVIVGILALVLMKYGNPPNMGFCIACFLRDIAGAVGLDRAAKLQYLRPEIVGLVLGAWISALITRDFRPVGGAAPWTRFVLGFFAMIGFLAFMGCPLRMVLRLAAGDLNAVVGLLGLVVGVLIGIFFINRRFTLGRAQPQSRLGGHLFPGAMLILLLFIFLKPSFILYSTSGPGSMHAPVLLSLAAGAILGILAQRVRLCMIGGFRDYAFFRDSYLLTGFLAILITVFLGDVFWLHTFKLGFAGQPIVNPSGLWNFLGMTLGGMASVLLGGCPLRQLVAASEGNMDAAVAVTGMIVGAALAYNFNLAATTEGMPPNGQLAVILGLILTAVIGWASRPVGVAQQVQA